MAGCLFCGGSPLTVEDVLSRWAQPLLLEQRPSGREGKRVRGVNTIYDNANPREPKPIHQWFKDKPEVKSRSVCAPCNNGWMSNLEGSTKPILTEMIKGRTAALTGDEQKRIADWLALKGVLTAEVNMPGDFDRSWAQTVYANKGTPSHWRARLGRSTTSNHLYMGSANLTYTARHPLAPFPLTYKGFHFTAVIGHFVGQVVAVSPYIEVDMNRDYFVSVWPRTTLAPASQMWPPKLALTDDQLPSVLGDPHQPPGRQQSRSVSAGRASR